MTFGYDPHRWLSTCPEPAKDVEASLPFDILR